MDRFISLIGLFVLLAIAWGMSNNRKGISLRLVLWGLGLQFIFAVLILKTSAGKQVFSVLNDGIVAILSCTKEGASFVFGNLVNSTIPVGTSAAGGQFVEQVGTVAKTGSFLAFSVLPTIIFFSAFMAILYYFGVMQKIVVTIAWVMAKTMRTSGPESLSCAANIFVGQTEAPLIIRPYMATLSNSEIMTVMTGGFATIAGGVMAAYVGFLQDAIPQVAGHLMAASVMNAPAALIFSKIMFPETKKDVGAFTGSMVKMDDRNFIDAAARGTLEGLGLALNVAAMLIAFLALIAVANLALGALGSLVGFEGLSFALILGKIFAPLAFLMGIPWADASQAGMLLGNKIVLNEFVAYLQLLDLSNAHQISERTAVIVTYALCGFANIGSIGIQIGGIGALAPDRRKDLAVLGPKAMVAGAFASFSTACIAGLLI